MALVPSTSVGSGSGGGASVQVYDNTASGAIASWDVSGIAQTYSHLQILLSGRSDEAAIPSEIFVRLNNDSGANYDSQLHQGNNATTTVNANVGSTGFRDLYVAGALASANVFNACEILLLNYAGAGFKTGVGSLGLIGTPGTAATYRVYKHSFLWRSTAAITRVTVLPISGNFVAGSRLSIYGIT